MTLQLDNNDRDDWACPVVWCVDLPADEIAWSDAAAPAQRQDLARRLLPPGIAPGEPVATVTAESEIWSQQRRPMGNRQGIPGAIEVRSGWLGRVLTQQRINRQMVVALDFRGGSSGNVLRD